MIALSLNVRGLGDDHKRSWVKRLCLEHKVHFLGLQETLINNDDTFFIKDLCPSIYPGEKSSLGHSRENHTVSDSCCLTITLGDFNEVHNDMERSGSIFHRRGAQNFNDFINTSGDCWAAEVTGPLKKFVVLRNRLQRLKRTLTPCSRVVTEAYCTIYDIKSKLTQTALDVLCMKYHIPADVHPELPGLNQNVLEHFHINLSQLSVFSTAKISYFEILCRVHGFEPTVGNFRVFYINSQNKGWMSFSKRSDVAPVCHSKPLDSVNWNDHFFWVDATAFPLSVSLHKSKTLKKDPFPKPSQYNAEVCDFLRTHAAPF
ncbi:gypsy type transposase [Tanacetum coccineum]